MTDVPVKAASTSPELGEATPTLREAFCLRYRVRPERFVSAMLRRTAPLQARLAGLLWPALLNDDRVLLAECADETSIGEIDRHIRMHLNGSFAWGFARRRLRLRISMGRLGRVARRCLRN
jgi:hypothetical protein